MKLKNAKLHDIGNIIEVFNIQTKVSKYISLNEKNDIELVSDISDCEFFINKKEYLKRKAIYLQNFIGDKKYIINSKILEVVTENEFKIHWRYTD